MSVCCIPRFTKRRPAYLRAIELNVGEYLLRRYDVVHGQVGDGDEHHEEKGQAEDGSESIHY
uniref:Uncharacterized protein n=1 Tax=Pristionchus pacificus TaxID=54126 RepID=A0A2A6CI38_PRIPA|eukprot:PDM77738.1 hypothetical protein PRIPAC_34605 [Pristionchus pacificus]